MNFLISTLSAIAWDKIKASDKLTADDIKIGLTSWILEDTYYNSIANEINLANSKEVFKSKSSLKDFIQNDECILKILKLAKPLERTTNISYTSGNGNFSGNFNNTSITQINNFAEDKCIEKVIATLPEKYIDIIGRDGELVDIESLIQTTNQVVLVNSVGGIGKTEFCKAYFNKYINNYKHVGWINYIGSIKESFDKQIHSDYLNFEADDLLDERFRKIVEFLQGLDKNTLLVIDNIENDNDPDLVELCKLPFKVIVSSRFKFDMFKEYKLKFLDVDDCKKLFYRYYDGEEDDVNLEKIINLSAKHTLTIELLAKTARNAVLAISELHEILLENGFNLNDVIKEKVSTLWNNSKGMELFFSHLLKVFKLSNITDEEQEILMNLSILPPIDIKINNLKEFLFLESNNDTNSLINKGWIQRNKQSISMHPLIQEVIRYKLKPNAKKCEKLIGSIAEKLCTKANENPINKKEDIILGEYVLKYTNENTAQVAILMTNLGIIYNELGQRKKNLEIQLKAVEIMEGIVEPNDLSLGICYSNLANAYQALKEYKESLKFNFKALNTKQYENEHKSIALTCNDIGLNYLGLGKLEKSLNYLLKSKKISERILEKNDSRVGTVYSNLSGVYQDLCVKNAKLGLGDKARDFQLKSIEIASKAKDIMEAVLDSNDPRLPGVYNNLAEKYCMIGKLDKGLEFMIKCLKIAEAVLDENHPDLIIYYENISGIYIELEHFKEAFEYKEKASKIINI